MLGKYIFLLILTIATSCGKIDPKESSSDLYLNPGDILITATNADDLVAFDKEGRYSRMITNVDRSVERIGGSTWSNITNELLIAIDGVDRVDAISGIDGTIRNVISNTNLTGTIRGLAQLTNGDIIIAESNTLERFTKTGVRITANGFPLASVNTPNQVRALSDGGFIVCAGGTSDSVKVFDSTGTLLASDSGPTAHDATGCGITNEGKIAVAWSGASDQVWLYPDSTLVGGAKIIDNADVIFMPSPNGLAISKDGNILVVDMTYHFVLEFLIDGTFVRTFGVLNTPTDISVIR